MAEEVVALFKKVRVSFLSRYILIFLLLTASVFLLWNLKILLAAAITILLCLFAWIELIITMEDFTLTDDCVTYKKGLLNIQTNSIMYDDIVDIQVNQDLLGQLFNYGTIRIDSAGTNTFEIRFDGLKDPHKIRTLIEEQEVRFHKTKLGTEKSR